MTRPGINFKPIKGDGLLAQRDFREVGAYILIEFVAIHTQIARRIALADKSGKDWGSDIHALSLACEQWAILAPSLQPKRKAGLPCEGTGFFRGDLFD
jgi:hypothetical protein